MAETSQIAAEKGPGIMATMTLKVLCIVYAVLFFLFGALLLGLDSVVGLIFNIQFDMRLLLVVLSFGFGTCALVGVAVSRLARRPWPD